MKSLHSMKACLSLLRIHVAEGLQYRLAALSGGSIAVFWGLIELSVFTAFFTHASNHLNTGGMTLPMTVTYVWLAQALFALQPMNLDGDIRNQIIKGDVGVALLRPLDLYWHWYFKTAASRLASSVLRIVPVILVAMLIPGDWRIGAPATLAGFMLFLLSVGCAFFLCISYGMLVTAIRLNVTWGDGPTYMLMLIGSVLSGTYLPLKLWPDALQGFLYIQPFAGYMDLPARIYLGLVPPTAAMGTVLLQIGWAAAFVLLGRVVMRRKLKTLIVQGG